jgi:hypothetical protein
MAALSSGDIQGDAVLSWYRDGGGAEVALVVACSASSRSGQIVLVTDRDRLG